MKRRIIIAILTVISLFCLVSGLTACGIFGEKEHEHVFFQHNTDDKYLKSEATCTTTALYYYSCVCGEKGEDVFVDGKPLGHTGGTATCSEQAVCERCGEKYGKPAYNNHDYIDGVCVLCDEPRTAGLKYAISADKEYYSVSKGGCSAERVYIPASHKGKPVRCIEKNGFAGSSKLESVIIPDSVTSIGSGAFFDCGALTSVAIPDTVTVIEGDMFCDCSRLAVITIPNKVTRIGAGAFRNCSAIESITIPNSVTSIGSGAFRNCMKLKDIVIPSSVTDIASGLFDGCASLTSVTIPDSVTTIGNGAFNGCRALTAITIPSSVTKIDSNAFYYCTGLAGITLPESVAIIGNSAFSYCSALASVTISATVTTIGDHAFSNCHALTDVYYTGSREDWEKITVGYDNENLLDADIRFNNI